jgi:hypothetical protein
VSDDVHPELAGYEPGDGRPVRNPMTLRVMRVVVVLGLIGLLLPGILVTWSTQLTTADAACRIVVASLAPDAPGANARLELLGAQGPDWYCYAVQFDGSEVPLRTLGIIPGLD